MINYYLITKPGIILGNLVTVGAGFLLASQGKIDIGLFSAILIGLTFIIASACVFNNYIDRDLDQKMERTKNRPLVSGAISGRNALLFATLLGAIGFATFFAYTNMITVAIAAIAFFVYVILYSMWKRHTIYGTAIGSIAGAAPPVIGYCAVSGHFDLGAFILFAMMVLWQMPHFFSIAVYHYHDYAAADIPVLPVRKGLLRTKIHMVFYIIAFMLASLMLTWFNYTGYVYLSVIMCMGLAWLGICFTGFKCEDDQVWGRDMFRLSLLMIGAICFVIPFDTI